MSISLTIPSVACGASGNGATVTFRVGTGGSDASESRVGYELQQANVGVIKAASYTDNAYGSLRYTFTVENLADGKYLLVANNESDEVQTREVTVACGPGPTRLELLVRGSNVSAPGASDGTLTGTAKGGTAPLTALVVETGETQPVTAGQAFVFGGKAKGVYTVRITDSGIPTPQQVQDTATVDEVALGGCTDPLATNPTPGATIEDGSCVYTPPVVKPFFSVPLLQSLRFVVRGRGQSFDDLLFCEQPRPGQQQRPYYYQLVQSDDQVRVQVLTSYDQVAATIYHHGGAAAAPAVPLERVLTLSGPATPLPVELSEHVATGTTRLRAVGGGALPPSLLAAARLTLGGAAGGTYRITQATPGSVVLLDDYLVLNRPWAPVAGAITATWLLIGPGYNVYEADLPLDTLGAGYYQVQLRATSSTQDWPAAVADSEPLHLKAQHANTVALDYKNADNCFGTVFTTGITPRLRLWATFFRQKNGGNITDYEDSAANRTILSSTGTRLTTLETYGQPAHQHEKVFLALRLDYLLVNGERHVTPANYETGDVRAYPLSGGHADLQKYNWLGVGNGDDAGVDDAPDNALGLTGGGFLLLRGR
jgi:hypothetical protein